MSWEKTSILLFVSRLNRFSLHAGVGTFKLAAENPGLKTVKQMMFGSSLEPSSKKLGLFSVSAKDKNVSLPLYRWTSRLDRWSRGHDDYYISDLASPPGPWNNICFLKPHFHWRNRFDCS